MGCNEDRIVSVGQRADLNDVLQDAFVAVTEANRSQHFLLRSVHGDTTQIEMKLTDAYVEMARQAQKVFRREIERRLKLELGESLFRRRKGTAEQQVAALGHAFRGALDDLEELQSVQFCGLAQFHLMVQEAQARLLELARHFVAGALVTRALRRQMNGVGDAWDDAFSVNGR